MDFRQFKYFVQVIEAKSFTHAAELLNVAQPALSHQIMKLEEELGRKLLIRHSRGVEPTEAGERLLICARTVLQLLDRVRQDLKELGDEPQGHVRLGLPYSLSDPLAIEFLQSCRLRYPKISLGIAEHLSGHLTELLLAGRLDLALTYSAEHLDVLSYIPILQERLCFVEHSDRPAKLVGEINFSEVAGHALILPDPTHLSRKLAESTAKYCGLRLEIAYEVNALPVTMEMVSRGLGATIQPFLAVRNIITTQPVTVRAITRPEITRRLHLAFQSRQPLSTPKRLIKDLVLDHLRRFITESSLSPLIQLEALPHTFSQASTEE